MKLFCLFIPFIFISGEKSVLWKTYQSYKQGFCSDQYYFYSDNTFYYSVGCEGRNNYAYGTYTKKGKNLCLIKDTLMNEKLIDTTYFTPNYDTTSLKIIVTDKFGRPINNCGFYLFSENSDAEFILEAMKNIVDSITKAPIILVYNVNGLKREVDIEFTNEKGELIIDANKKFKIAPILYFQMKNELKWIQTDINVNTLLKWNLPLEMFYYIANNYYKPNIMEQIPINKLK